MKHLFSALIILLVMSVFLLSCNFTALLRDTGPEKNVTENPIVGKLTPGATDPIKVNTENPSQTLPSLLEIGSTQVSQKDGMKMVYIPAGDFLMGSVEGVGNPNEHPQNTQKIKAFWIDETEVTNAMFT
jgi:formylglycine-generating enzyme required for sulfatase activity